MINSLVLGILNVWIWIQVCFKKFSIVYHVINWVCLLVLLVYIIYCANDIAVVIISSILFPIIVLWNISISVLCWCAGAVQRQVQP